RAPELQQQRRRERRACNRTHLRRRQPIALRRDTPAPAIYTLSLHDALPIWIDVAPGRTHAATCERRGAGWTEPETLWLGERTPRSEEHTSELQSPYDPGCRLLLEKKNQNMIPIYTAPQPSTAWSPPNRLITQ